MKLGNGVKTATRVIFGGDASSAKPATARDNESTANPGANLPSDPLTLRVYTEARNLFAPIVENLNAALANHTAAAGHAVLPNHAGSREFRLITQVDGISEIDVEIGHFTALEEKAMRFYRTEVGSGCRLYEAGGPSESADIDLSFVRLRQRSFGLFIPIDQSADGLTFKIPERGHKPAFITRDIREVLDALHNHLFGWRSIFSRERIFHTAHELEKVVLAKPGPATRRVPEIEQPQNRA